MKYPEHLDPATIERLQEQFLELAVAQLPEVRRDPRLREFLGLAFAPEGQPLVWRWLGDKKGKSYFEIGIAGELLTQFSTGERSVWWLWAAFDQGRNDTLRAHDFAAPGSTAPGASVRKALRITAPGIVGKHCPAAVARKIKDLALRIKVQAITMEAIKGNNRERQIEKQWVIRFNPRPDSVRVITS